MVRKCSHCGNNGHNSRTCHNNNNNNNGAKVLLFGVDLIQKQNDNDGNSGSSVNIDATNFVSDGISRPKHESKGIPWTQEEHKTFLAGLKQLGRGEWRRISREFVKTRTSTQVASHAQKYFMRIQGLNKKKNNNRSSIFDTPSGNHNNVAVTDDPQTDSIGTASKDKELTAQNFNQLNPNLGLGYSSSVNPVFPNHGRIPYMGGVIGGTGPAGYVQMMNYGRQGHPYIPSFYNNGYVMIPFYPPQALSMVSQSGGHGTSTVAADEDVNVELKLGPSSECSTSQPSGAVRVT